MLLLVKVYVDWVFAITLSEGYCVADGFHDVSQIGSFRDKEVELAVVFPEINLCRVEKVYAWGKSVELNVANDLFRHS